MTKDLWDGQAGSFGPTNWTAGAISPHVDVLENDREIMVLLELAGVRQDDIHLSIHNGVLVVYGEKRPHNKEEWERSHYLAERAFGTFRRTINLPYGLDDASAEAEFSDGVLTIHIPRVKDVIPVGRKIPITNVKKPDNG
ncbi:MAG: Hsp20/alpha crystallin family protein [Candidatus Competibacteraceae bacterium]|nr:Hsp20/alpha crystallin family protein [Candidatus Competibacteraceae bacterium]